MKTQASTQLEELQIKIRYDEGEPLMAGAPLRAITEGLPLDVVRELAAAPWDYRSREWDEAREKCSHDRRCAASAEIEQLLGVNIDLNNGQVLMYLAARDYGLRVTFVPDPDGPADDDDDWC